MADQAFMQEMLNRGSGEAKPPPPLPSGTYLLEVAAVPTLQTNERTGTGFFEMRYKILEASQDIDPSTLPEGWQQRSCKDNVYVTEDSLHRVDKFFACMGISKGTPYAEGFASMQGKHVLADLESKPTKGDPNVFYIEIKGYESAE